MNFEYHGMNLNDKCFLNEDNLVITYFWQISAVSRNKVLIGDIRARTYWIL